MSATKRSPGPGRASDLRTGAGTLGELRVGDRHVRLPRTDTADAGDGGIYNHFTGDGDDGQGASVMWSSDSGVHGVKGAIRNHGWRRRNGVVPRLPDLG